MDHANMHPVTIDGRDASTLRGDPITGDRYTSPEFMQREWDHMWTRIWHIAGRTAELEEAGDYVVHDFLNESVFCVKQADGSIKAFYNSCRHRGMRLVDNSAAAAQFQCPYHGWIWGQDGVLSYAQDAHDFPQGDPCGKLKLKELRCDTWGGFVWYTMDDNAPSLLDYLSPMPEIYRNYPMDTAVRVVWMKIDLNTHCLIRNVPEG
jgi:phenylpropionate dioxygenase-like ring-hydroxylating dioxygenase large terminal subunit